jgi:hypothetical protein
MGDLLELMRGTLAAGAGLARGRPIRVAERTGPPLLGTDIDIDPKAQNRYQNKQENEMLIHRELLASGRLDDPAGRKCVQRKGLQTVNAPQFIFGAPAKTL